jgi:hypothetical protein
MRRIEVIRYRHRVTVTEEREPPYAIAPPVVSAGTADIGVPELEVVNALRTSPFSIVSLRNLLNLRGWFHTGQRR